MATQSISPTRCCLYARVSTTNGGQHPEMQLAELREHALRRGWTVAGEFTDQISGSKDSRPALNKLMAQAHRREFDVVLVWKLDRWGRSLKHLVNSLAELDSLGVAFVSLRDNFDLTTPSGRLMFSIVGAMAEFERALIQERVKAGIAHARVRGKRLGRPRANVDLALLAARRQEGASWRQLAAEFHVDPATLLRTSRRCENPAETAVANA